jgi:hypothetical protein
VRAECDSFCSLVELVRQGGIYTILPAASLSDEIARGCISSSLIVEPTIERSLVLALPPNKPVAAGVTELTRLVKNAVRSVYPARQTPIEASGLLPV